MCRSLKKCLTVNGPWALLTPLHIGETMTKYLIISATILLAGCSVAKDMIHEKASTPPPKQDLFSFGSHYTARGSTEIATDKAEEFCYR